MRWLAKLSLRLRSLVGKAGLDRELDDELRFHIEREIEANLAAGMSPEAARRAAMVAFGGVDHVKEECRDMRRVTLAHDLVKDLGFAARIIRKHLGFTAVAVLILALGIGANTTIFSFVDAALLRSLPVLDPDQLVVLSWRAHGEPKTHTMMSHGDCNGAETSPRAGTQVGCSFSLPFFDQLRGRRDLFAGVAAFSPAPRLLVSEAGAPDLASGQLVSGEYFTTLGVRAALGRTIEPNDDARSVHALVLSHPYWQSAFGGDPAIVGKTLVLNGVSFDIVGVADAAFTRLTPGHVPDMWLPLSVRWMLEPHWDPTDEDGASWWLTIVVRLRPEVTAAQLAAATSLLFRNDVVAGAKPVLAAADEPEVRAIPASSGLAGSRVETRRLLLVLMMGVGLILLIACANVAGLLLARAASRRREIAVRLAMGAGRGRIIRQLLTESLLLAVISGALGALLSVWGVQALVTVVAHNQSGPLGFDVAVDARVLAFTTAVSLSVGMAFGLAPAFRATRVDLAATLKEGSAGSLGTRTRLGGVLVVAQVALSVLVLVGAGLLLRSLDELRRVEPGFRTDNVLRFSIEPTLAGYPSNEIHGLYRELRDELTALPGVTSVGWSDMRLLSGTLWTSQVRLVDSGERNSMQVDVMGVGPGFFDTLQIPLLAGRTLSAEDIDAAWAANAAPTHAVTSAPAASPASPRVAPAVVNQEFARHFFPDRSPLGERFQRATDGPSPTWQIVGVVGDTKYSDLRRHMRPAFYRASTADGVTFTVSTATEPGHLIAQIRAVVGRVAPKLPVVDLKTQSAEIEQILFRESIMARLSSMFAGLALTLACIGLYALLSYEVARRDREVGIRMALGARRAHVRRMVVKQGLGLTLVGLAVGMGGAVAVTRPLQALLYGVRPTDPTVLGGVSILLLLVAFLACYLPARRATRVDPMIVLRSE